MPHRKRDVRPWGRFEQFTLNEPSTVKLLFVGAGESLSLQRHVHRREHWYVVDGEGLVTLGDTQQKISSGQECDILEGVLHRVTGGSSGLVILEIAFGVFDENDIERVDDMYGRT